MVCKVLEKGSGLNEFYKDVNGLYLWAWTVFYSVHHSFCSTANKLFIKNNVHAAESGSKQ